MGPWSSSVVAEHFNINFAPKHIQDSRADRSNLEAVITAYQLSGDVQIDDVISGCSSKSRL